MQDLHWKKRTLSLDKYYHWQDFQHWSEAEAGGGLLFEKCRLNLHLIWRNCLHAPLGVHHFASSEYWICSEHNTTQHFHMTWGHCPCHIEWVGGFLTNICVRLCCIMCEIVYCTLKKIWLITIFNAYLPSSILVSNMSLSQYVFISIIKSTFI